MSTISPIAAAASGQSASAQGTAAITSDFQTFLKLMTTQMQNQDPTDPIESSDYAVQLATFSQVEQQVKTNQTLSAMSERLGLNGMSAYAGWVGMTARAEVGAQFDGATPVEVDINPASGADQAVLVVKDASGAELARLPVPVADQSLYWQGEDGRGGHLPAGAYDFALESYSNGSLLSSDTAATYSTIVEARQETYGLRLILQGGASVLPEDVTALRSAGQ